MKFLRPIPEGYKARHDQGPRERHPRAGADLGFEHWGGDEDITTKNIIYKFL
jgi:hypothetical protein